MVHLQMDVLANVQVDGRVTTVQVGALLIEVAQCNRFNLRLSLHNIISSD